MYQEAKWSIQLCNTCVCVVYHKVPPHYHNNNTYGSHTLYMGDAKWSCLCKTCVFVVYHTVCHHIIVATLTGDPLCTKGSRQLCKTVTFCTTRGADWSGKLLCASSGRMSLIAHLLIDENNCFFLVPVTHFLSLFQF